MFKGNTLFIVMVAAISVVVGGGVGALITGYLTHEKLDDIEARVRADWELVPVIVFNSGLPGGAALDSEHVAKMLLPKTFVTPNLVLPGRFEEVIGKELVVSVTRGDLLLWSMINKDVHSGWELKHVVVFNRELEEGTVVTREHLAMMNMPVRFITPSMVPPDKVEALVGQKLKVPVQPGDLLLSFMLGKEPGNPAKP